MGRSLLCVENSAEDLAQEPEQEGRRSGLLQQPEQDRRRDGQHEAFSFVFSLGPPQEGPRYEYGGVAALIAGNVSHRAFAKQEGGPQQMPEPALFTETGKKMV